MEPDAEIVSLGRAEWRIVADPLTLDQGVRVKLRYEAGPMAGTVVFGDVLSVGVDTIRLHSGSAYTDAILPRLDQGDLIIERLTRLP